MTPIGLLDANDQLVECELDGIPYYLGVSWNEAGQLWAMSVRDLDRQLLVSGIRIVPLYPLLQQVRRPELPPGEIGVDCAPGTALTRRAFADATASLWYFDTDDLAEIAAIVPPAPVYGRSTPIPIPAHILYRPQSSTDAAVLTLDDGVSTITDDNGNPIEV